MAREFFSNFLTIALIVLALSSNALSQRSGNVRFNNQLEGRVVGERNAPVNNAYVELYNDTRALVGRTRTSSQGRFSFRSLGQGRYYVVVKPYGTNLKEEEEMLEVFDQSVSGGVFFMEVQLQVDNRFRPPVPLSSGTIFAQDVPRNAQRLYRLGVDKLNAGDQKGTIDLDSAISEFPTYFDALSFLGRYYVSQGKFEDGYPILLRAIDVNKRCPECFYSLGFAFYKLDQVPAGLQATSAALILVPASAEVNLLHGILLRLNQQYDAAEKALLKAKSEADDPNPEVHWQLSLVYNRLNRNEDAARELEEYMKAKRDMDSSEKQKVRELIAKLRKTKAKN